MYSPAYNRNPDRADVLDFMRANNFVVFVTGGGGELHASHLPVMVEERGETLFILSHMAKSNPQWEQFWEGEDAEDVLVVFHGPHAYVSPRWYAEKERVPTWNYAAVHAYGRVRAIQAHDEKHSLVARLVAQHDPQWLPQFEQLSPQYMEGMRNGIVAFEVEVKRLETRWKLSQNRGREEMELIAAALEQSSDSAERATAALTRRHLVK